MEVNQYLKIGTKIVKTLNEYTYEAYFIGGVVRDYILNCPFVDIDITTSASPGQISQIFEKCDLSRSRYGTTIVEIDGFKYEITTFREEEYDQPRALKAVHFSKNLKTDLIRRDFTVNALAMTDHLKIIDLVEGQKDLKDKMIRMVGSSKTKFTDDPLRILRGFELMARFNFSFESKTWELIIKSRKSLPTISDYQLSLALSKIWKAKYGKKATKIIVEAKLDSYLKAYRNGFKYVKKHYKRLTLNEKFLLCYLANQEIPDNTIFDKKTLNQFKEIIEIANLLKEQGITRELLFNHEINDIICANKLNKIIYGRKYKITESELNNANSKLPIRSISQLALKGEDVVRLSGGLTGPFVQVIINKILCLVLNEQLNNDYQSISQMVLEELNNVDLTQPIVIDQKKDQVKDQNIVVPSFLESSLDQDDLIVDDNQDDLGDNPLVEIVTKVFEVTPEEEKSEYVQELEQVQELELVQDLSISNEPAIKKSDFYLNKIKSQIKAHSNTKRKGENDED